MATYSGKNARVRIGGATFLCAVKWSVSAKVDELDTTCFENSGFATYIGGIHEADVSIEGNWENNIHANPPNIGPNATLALELFIDATNLAGVKFTFPALLVTNCTVDVEVRGIVKYTITGKTVGSYSFPGGIVPS